MAKLTKASVDFPDAAPVRLSFDVKVNASPEAVWELLIDNPGWVHWFKGVQSCEDTSEPTTGVGATRQILINGLRADEEFIAWEPERLWAFTVVETNRTFARRWVERVELERAEANGRVGTLIRYATGMELLMLAKPFRPLLLRGIRQSWQPSLEGIDAYLAGR